MTGWGEFAAALAVFLLSHAVPVRPPVRPWLVARLGLRGYLVLYSIASVAVLAWLIVAAGRAPFVPVIPYSVPLHWLPVVAMPVACALVVAGMSIHNPLSFGGLGRGPFDPGRPGVLAVTRHPLLLALMLWAGAHFLANGDLAHMILFGLFAVFAWAGMALIDRRKRRTLGADAWATLARNTARISLAGLTRLRPRAWQVAAALGLYLGLLALHGPVIGVVPWP
ncbi:NnrU family protein [Roseovarius salinarum]|uniref:NnrU family protein n=1 Tax=Roseovarius salinarum TaxID=1981892 RepID=UPI000C340727|nr:NnrU family protein [Roseovarius salinarum]